MRNKLTILVATILGVASIVTTSAHAAPLSVTVAGVVNATTPTAPATVAVPTSNKIDGSNSIALVATADTGTTVTFTASNVKLVPALDSVSAPVTSASGTNSFSATSQGVALTVYAFTTSTNVGTVTITNGAYSTVVYIQGTAGVANNVSLSLPASTGVGTAPSVVVSVKDVFGNPVASEVVAVTLVGATFSDGSTTKNLTTATKAAAVADTTGATVWGSASYALAPVAAGTITAVASDVAIAASAVGLPAAVKSVTATIVVSDLVAQIASLNAQVAALTAALAAEKAGRAADKAADAKAALDAKTASDVAITAATLAQAKAEANYAALLKKYNAMAKKYKFAAIK